ncbi:MAG: hypothetical protein UV38_C0001G0137 [candidate division TM6 bacterium GW2011_GWE2_42_60]|nr:MAG: hypothetical protein UV38_C0001G0137 [candidate division TM6 bacterium GW2011_GWE2_42_60]HBY05667.1 hypothetical protein [Candidatus Dependentiae bacterium]
MKIKKILLITLLACPFLLTASNGKNEKIRLFSDAFENKTPDNNKKRKLVQQLVAAKYRNEKLPICNMPDDCWTVIAQYLPLKDKYALRLLSAYFKSLFYESNLNGNIEAPKIRSNMLTLPSFSTDENTVFKQRRHVAKFMEKTHIELLKIERPQDFVAPVQDFVVPVNGKACNGKTWHRIKKVSLENSSVNDTQFSIMAPFFPNLENLNLNACKNIDFKVFLNECKVCAGGVDENHPDRKALGKIAGINAMAEPQRSFEINKAFEENPNIGKYFSIPEWDKFKHLKTFDLGQTNIQAQGLQNILSNCSKLNNLCLDLCGHLLLGDLNWNDIANATDSLGIKELLPVYFRESLTKDHIDALVLLINQHTKTLKSMSPEKRADFMRNILKKHPAFFDYFVDLDWSTAKEITILSIKRPFITGPGLQKILSNCPKLKILDLRDCRGLSLENIDWSNVRELRILNVKGATNLSNKELEKIGRCCPKLTTLVLSNPKRDHNNKEADFDWTTGVDWTLFKNLTTLSLDNNLLISNESLKKIRKGCPQLKSLKGLICGDADSKFNLDTIDLSLLKDLTVLELGIEGANIEIKPEYLRYILDNCSFKKLFLSMESFPSGVFNWSKLGKSLECLHICYANIKHGALQKILQGCVNLKTLDLSCSCNSKFTLKNLNWSSLGGTLTSLDLSRNLMVEGCLQPILDSCINLKYLDLTACDTLPLKNLNWEKLKKLEYLDLSESVISLEGLLPILENCPLIKNLHLGKDNNVGLKEFYEGSPAVFEELKKLLIERIKKQELENPDNKKNKKDPREIEEK